MTFLEVSNFLRSNSDQSIELTVLHRTQNRDSRDSELSDYKILTSSNTVNGTERVSLDDSICSSTRPTGDITEEVNMSSVPSSVVSITYKTDQDYPSDKPLPKPRTTSRQQFNIKEIENLDISNKNLLKPVLSQLQESQPYEPTHFSSTSTFFSSNHFSNEGRKENTIPLSSVQLRHIPSPKDDVTQTATKTTSRNVKLSDTVHDRSIHKTGSECIRIIRKHTIDSFVTENAHTDTQPVRFIRKRAYASARHPGRYDQVNSLTSSNAATNDTGLPTTPLSRSNNSNSNTNTSPCQLLPAQKTPISSSTYNTEPKIIHLPRRRSSGGQTLQQKIHVDKSLIHNDNCQESQANRNMEMSRKVVPDDVHELNAPHSSTKENSSVGFNRICTGKPIHTAAVQASSKSSLLSSRLWASFDQDQNESVSELWTRAGEVYHMLELESQRLASKKAAAATANIRRYPGGFNDSHQMAYSFDSGEISTMRNTEFSSQLPSYSTPVTNCANDVLSIKTGRYGSHCTDCNHEHTNRIGTTTSTMNSTTKRLQFRALCPGIRSHRSELNILCDMSGSFLSRQCFCKILAINGSDNKSYAWKPYYMCVSGSEVKFIKASWAFYGAGRTSKASKNINDIVCLRNNSMNSLLDCFSKTLDLAKSEDGLNDDSISYHYPSNAETDCSSNTSNAGKSCVSVGSSASCIVLPIPGLIWRSEPLPTNFPHWSPLGPTSSNQVLNSRPNTGGSNTLNPDWMDPRVSGLSQPSQQILSDYHDCYNLPNTTDFHNNIITDDEDSRSKFRCFRFAHITAGVELLFVFPDDNAAITCLKMCQLSGGRDCSSVKQLELFDRQNSYMFPTYQKKSFNPYGLIFLKPSTHISLSEIPVKSSHSHSFSMKGNKYGMPLVVNSADADAADDDNDDDDDDIKRNVFVEPAVSRSTLDSPFINTLGPYCLPKDKRHRRFIINRIHMNQELNRGNSDDGTSVKNPCLKSNKYEDGKKFWTRRDKEYLDAIRSDNVESTSIYVASANNNYRNTTTTAVINNNNINSVVPSHISELTTTGVDDKSHSTNSIRSNKILRGFKQWLNRPIGLNTVNSNNLSTNSHNNNISVNTTNTVINFTSVASSFGNNINKTISHNGVNINNNPIELSSTDFSQSESPNNEHRLASLTVDPANLADLDNPGPVFGAPLELQLESPDYPCVPVLLQAIVVALEIHGLNLPGLYRKPGRHRTISQFVSFVNMHPEDVDFIFGLDAWREPNALCGLFKHFLRRLPVGLFCLSSWEPLFCLVPEMTTSSDVRQLAYLLLCIRVQLKKIALEAFGLPTMNTMPVDVQYCLSVPTDGCVNLRGLNSTSGGDTSKLSISPPISPQTLFHCKQPISCNVAIQSKDDSFLNMKKNKDFNTSKRSFCAWRWATLCYLVDHITRVVAHVHRNAVTYQCIAICFGPVFFGNSSKLPKLNEVLECLFQHWDWLIEGLPMITKNNVEHVDNGTLLYTMNDDEPTLSDAITYLTNQFNSYNKSSSSGSESIGQRQELLNTNSSYQLTSKPTNRMLVQQSSLSEQEQMNCDLDSNVERFDNEDELINEVVKQVKALWSAALDKVKQANRLPVSKEKSYIHSKTISFCSLHRTASAIPKASTETNGHTGVRRLTVGTESPSPHLSSMFDYYCMSPPHFLCTKDVKGSCVLH
ncbi:unnamed protein product [Heterobilharzia americana]|nr:unnamed protein product [Heterobilharzia americana]